MNRANRLLGRVGYSWRKGLNKEEDVGRGATLEQLK
jgi:hypothetical protein